MTQFSKSRRHRLTCNVMFSRIVNLRFENVGSAMAKAEFLWILCWDSRWPQELAADAMVLGNLGLLVEAMSKLKHKNSSLPKSFV